MRAGTVKESRTGEILTLKYDPIEEGCYINGIEAKRMPELETHSDERVYSLPDEKAFKILHILVEDLNQLPDALI